MEKKLLYLRRNYLHKDRIMELKDFIGKHELSGVETDVEPVECWKNHYENANVIRFIIDGHTYKAIENPDDGFRSYLSDIVETEKELMNTFPPQKVIGEMINTIIGFTDAVTKKPVLEIGTCRDDNDYPECVLAWLPENLAINIDR